MSEPQQIIPQGAIFTITTGSYSDYYVRGVFRAVVEIRAGDLLAEWLAEHPEQNRGYDFKDSDFLASVARKGLLEPIDSFEWHVDGGFGAATAEVSACDALKLAD